MKPNRVVSWIALLLAPAPAGCFFDDLLSVDAPDRVSAAELEDPRNAQLLVTSAIADFECALTNYIAAAGLLGDELADGQLDSRLWDYDRRSINPAGTPVYAVSPCDNVHPGVYQTLQTARFAADNAIRLLQSPMFLAANIPNHTTLLATVAAYSGYSHLLLGEAMCSAAVDGGPELTPQQMWELAEQKLTLAIDMGVGAGASEVVNMARLGRARTRLDLGRGVEAVADAQLVPPGFRKEAQYSAATERSSNRIWRMNNRDNRITIEDDFRNVTHMGVADPRAPVQDAGATTRNPQVALWTQAKYPQRDSPMPIARHAEAQLIIAEVLGDTAAVRIINELHAAAGLPPFAATDPDSIRRHVIEERRLELFLESHHFFDKLRFNALLDPDPLPDTPAAGAPFITGGTYGATTCLPLPDVERLNNPNIP
ncbi:MAG: RagB/SusD family nutrient uptake outer membrane protein [Gemmatimonadales bacterium]